MFIKYFLRAFLTILAATVCDSARILAIVPTPSYSHQVAFQLLWKELSLRGHHVTLLTTDPMNDATLTNLTEINLHFAYELWNEKHNITSLINIAQEDNVQFLKKFREMTVDIIEHELQHPQVQSLIKNVKKEHFDLVLAEFLHPSMYAFAELYKCPFIGISSLEAIGTLYDAMGSLSHPALYPDFTLNLVPPLTFIERVLSSLYSAFLKLYIEFVVNPQETQLIRKHFGENLPLSNKIRSKISMVFVNTDPVFNYIRPLTPNIIPIGGGSHLQPKKPLPKNLQDVLDNEREGVIYFSLGTNVKPNNIRKETFKVILETFSEIPYKVLWKLESEKVENKSKNVIISKWFPQQDILRHPNVKLFITQGGWQSVQESIYSHTPMIGLPFFVDQFANIKTLVAKGIALSLDHKTMTKEALKNAILAVIENPSYRRKVKELAELAQDQPMTGLERAIWWTEYVLRHKGAAHLRSPAIDIPFIQYYLLDVIGFCLVMTCVSVFIIMMLLRHLLLLVIRSNLPVKIKKF